jgi:hypothetical protein
MARTTMTNNGTPKPLRANSPKVATVARAFMRLRTRR